MKSLTKWEAEDFQRAWRLVETAAFKLAEFYEAKVSSGHSPAEALRRLFIDFEWSFSLPLMTKKGRKTTVNGRIDWLAEGPSGNEIFIWDFKTSDAKETLTEDLIQVALYSYAVKESLGLTTKAALLYLTEDEVKEEIIAEDKIQAFYDLALGTIDDIMDWISATESKKGGMTPPATRDKNLCLQCKVIDVCTKWYGNPPSLSIEELKLRLQQYKDSRRRSEPKRTTTREAPRTVTSPESHSRMDVERKEQPFHIGSDRRKNEPFYIHPRVLNKHVAILGASGSGKTVLGKTIIEEALLHGYSALLIDPQGDLCSLLLPSTKDLPNRLSEQIGQNYVKNWKIYTPGSSKGIKLVINPLERPNPSQLADADYRLTILDMTASMLLMIMGYKNIANSPEKAVLESLILDGWLNDQAELTFVTLARKLEDTESIISVHDNLTVPLIDVLSERNRKKLRQNLLKLAIGTEGAFFQDGESLNLNNLVQTPSNLNVVSLQGVGADPTKRQLVVSWILRQVYEWMLNNPQASQDDVRLFLYLDEVADFLPPHPYSPPSKKILMLLFRQARKYGVSCIIATQSPASIDYKALDNVKTFMIGRIPTPQSRRKLEEYLAPYHSNPRFIMDKAGRANTGEFIVIGGGQTKPASIKVRRLLSPHQTLSLDDVAKIMKSQ